MSTDEGRQQEVYLINRKNQYFAVENLWFPLAGDPSFERFHTDTIIDGELVVDVQDDGSSQTVYLAFDCLSCDGKNLISRDLTKRLGYLKQFIIEPHHKLLQAHPVAGNGRPFE